VVLQKKIIPSDLLQNSYEPNLTATNQFEHFKLPNLVFLLTDALAKVIPLFNGYFLANWLKMYLLKGNSDVIVVINFDVSS